MNPTDFFSHLDAFQIEVPSWGFADTGTRFGKFTQDAAASTIEEKLEDAGLINRLTGACPTVAVHVLWDFKPGSNPGETAEIAAKNGVKIGSINPNLFQDQIYKFGSCTSPDALARDAATAHVLDSIEIGKATKSDLLSFWFADGTNYPGQDDIIARKHRMEAALKEWHDAMPPEMTMLIEYKPFEPAFYHTDSADWGMAAFFARKAGPRAKVLVDTGHHLPGANIEHIVAFLLDEDLLGGFHFNDRKYADDDLTLGSIDPYAVFRIFHEIRNAAERGVDVSKIAYMIDQSHNLKPKLEAMLQTVVTAQELYLKACLVNREKLAKFQAERDIVGAEETLRAAFYTDVQPILQAWRESKGLPVNPLQTLRESQEIARRAQERPAGRAARGEVAGGGYA
ncbi:L-rhamnose isomerase / sugar isomerase [Abditibacterium utsteinense]|uniref:L-rhamnose isomerase / sugar isomerase n=1 Tax=Abditibacterium utsteinense TaxID=1960156 RepID=A0A2S8STS6_9BACT|nr:TIM barrel protein [Abditibacterium utsteinense]PQV64201.1 L-rhamnose isomerase / sugar isomerase [Abditibacterium utsteinense]